MPNGSWSRSVKAVVASPSVVLPKPSTVPGAPLDSRSPRDLSCSEEIKYPYHGPPPQQFISKPQSLPVQSFVRRTPFLSFYLHILFPSTRWIQTRLSMPRRALPLLSASHLNMRFRLVSRMSSSVRSRTDTCR